MIFFISDLLFIVIMLNKTASMYRYLFSFRKKKINISVNWDLTNIVRIKTIFLRSGNKYCNVFELEKVRPVPCEPFLQAQGHWLCIYFIYNFLRMEKSSFYLFIYLFLIQTMDKMCFLYFSNDDSQCGIKY